MRRLVQRPGNPVDTYGSAEAVRVSHPVSHNIHFILDGDDLPKRMCLDSRLDTRALLHLLALAAAIIRRFKESYPDLHYHITSGDTEQVTEKLDKGIIDFAVLAQEPNTAKYHYLTFPHADLWGVVMPKNCPLAEKGSICVEDLFGLPLFCSEQGWSNDISKWCGNNTDKLHLEGSFRLSYNGSLFVKEGLGYLLTFEHLIDTSPDSGLAFRPLTPKLETKMYLIWKKYQVFTPIAERLLEMLKAGLSE